jgi:hypothetical protein
VTGAGVVSVGVTCCVVVAGAIAGVVGAALGTEVAGVCVAGAEVAGRVVAVVATGAAASASRTGAETVRPTPPAGSGLAAPRG